MDGLDAVRDALSGQAEVDLAIAFGSRARGSAAAGADLDLGVIALRADSLELSAQVAIALGSGVDVVDLETAGYRLLASIVRDGVVVHKARRGAGPPGEPAPWRRSTPTHRRTDACATRGCAGSRREGRDMVRRDLVAAKLAELAERPERVRAQHVETPDAFANDRDAREIVAFDLRLAMQSCLDLASQHIADEG